LRLREGAHAVLPADSKKGECGMSDKRFHLTVWRDHPTEGRILRSEAVFDEEVTLEQIAMSTREGDIVEIKEMPISFHYNMTVAGLDENGDGHSMELLFFSKEAAVSQMGYYLDEGLTVTLSKTRVGAKSLFAYGDTCPCGITFGEHHDKSGCCTTCWYSTPQLFDDCKAARDFLARSGVKS